MKRFVKITLILLFVFTGKILFAQQIDVSKLDSLFNILSSKNLMMGSVAISQGNKIAYKKSFGYRYIDGGKEIANDEYTKYRVGSITKLFTSVMIFQLVREHKLSLDTKLVNFFPQIKNADKITIANMMYHRSGIHDAINDTMYSKEIFSAHSESEVLHLLEKLPSDFEPDAKSAYSNSNFTLLGYIVERLDKDDYATSLKNRILDKLHLKNTHIGKQISETDNEAFPYFFTGVSWISIPMVNKIVDNNAIAAGGAGAIISTPLDLNRFLNGLFDGTLINQNSLSQDTTIRGTYGMDITKVPFYNNYGWGHSGAIGGFHSDLFKFLKGDITVAVCYNGVNFSTNEVLIGILSCCFDKPFNFAIFDKPTIIKVDTAVFQKYIGNYASDGIPLKIKIFVQDGKLYAQATGQPALPLNAVSEKEFVFEEANIDILFDAEKNEFILNQNDKKYLFKKEE